MTTLSALLLSAGAALAASEGPAQSGLTQDDSEPGTYTAVQLSNSPLKPSAPDYSDSTDHELTRLGARWDALSAPEREALLREVKLRMAQRKDADGVLVIRTQRRFGSVYSGGSRYLKIETKVIRVRPAEGGMDGSSARGAAKRGFGTGFEQRNAQPATHVEPAQAKPELPPLDASVSPPVVQTGDPSS